ncbi:PREDICTED: probable beta-1,3-galactosyltransferase 12 [Prunus mume]|uniref:Probable beta-1,3-galactosyltransferase 12 n=1 Tax=Prunus mume TaxID=102107 RepID=A0ABM0PUK9_PRUMU|nr:PREDICTED: probable beta-1,3-galactosyltransferase 12 [Prunus mume]
MGGVQKEIDKYRDFLVIDVNEDYVKTSTSNTSRQGENTFTNPYWMHEEPKMKWYEKSGHLIGSEYVRHAYGPIYVLSAEVVAPLAIARNNRKVIG